jgi:hypothetical protein
VGKVNKENLEKLRKLKLGLVKKIPWSHLEQEEIDLQLAKQQRESR